MSSDDEVEEVEEDDEAARGRARLSEAEDATLPYLPSECAYSTPFVRPRTLCVTKQRGDTCLVHAIVNATQRPDLLPVLLAEVRRLGQLEGWDHRDKCTGMRAVRTVLGRRMKNGFDVYRDVQGIAHVYLHNGSIDHFVALRRHDGALYLLDSLSGRAALVTKPDALCARATLLRIV